MPGDKIKLLYEAVSQDYDVGTIEEFETKLADPAKRKAFYEGVGAEYELGSYEDFEGKIAGEQKKSPAQTGTPLVQPPSGVGSFGSTTAVPYAGSGSKPVKSPKYTSSTPSTSTSGSDRTDNDFNAFVKTLPPNLKNTDQREYNLKGYWEALGKPKAFDYSQPKEEDGTYHAFSRNPETGEILKSKNHPTFKQALAEDAAAGYLPYESPDGKVFTFQKGDKIPAGFKPYTEDRTHKNIPAPQLSGDAPVQEINTTLAGLPKESRRQKYTKAFDINIQQVEQIAPKIESGEATPEEAELYDQALTKAQFFEKALEGQDKLEEINQQDKNRFVDVGMNDLGALLANSGAAMARTFGKANPNFQANTEEVAKWFDERAKGQAEKGDYYRKVLDRAAGYEGKDIAQIYKEKGLAGAIAYASKRFTESAPLTAYIVGMSAIGAGAVANAQLFGGTFNQKYQENTGREDMSESAKQLNALGYAGTELIFDGILNTGFTSLTKQYIKQFGKEAAKEELKKTILGTIRQGLKKYAPLTELFGESLGEGATQLSQNLIDIYTDPTKKDLNPLEGVLDAAAIGAVGGSGFAGLTVGGRFVNRAANKKKLADLEQKKADILATQEQVSEATAEALEDDKAKIEQEQNEVMLADREILEGMSEEQREYVKNVEDVISDMQADMEQIQDEAGKEIIQEKIDEKQAEVDAIYDETETLLKSLETEKLSEDEKSDTNPIPATTDRSEPAADNINGESGGDTGVSDREGEGTQPEHNQSDTGIKDGASDSEGVDARPGTGVEPSQEPLVGIKEPEVVSEANEITPDQLTEDNTTDGKNKGKREKGHEDVLTPQDDPAGVSKRVSPVREKNKGNAEQERSPIADFNKKYGFKPQDVLSEVANLTQHYAVGEPIKGALAVLKVEDGQIEQAEKDMVLAMLSDKLPSKLPPAKQKIYTDIEGEVPVRPIHTKVKPVNGDLVSKQQSLKDVASSDEIRPALTGIYHDAKNKRLIATDANAMVILEDDRVSETRIVDKKTGHAIDEKYPDYDVVVPRDNPIETKANAQELLDKVSGIVRAHKFVNTNNTQFYARIRVGGIEIFFDPALLQNTLKAFVANGATDVVVKSSTPNRGIYIKGDGAEAVVMPRLNDRGGVPYTTIIDRDLSSAENDAVFTKEIEGLQRDIARRKEDVANDQKEGLTSRYNTEKIAEAEREIAALKKQLSGSKPAPKNKKSKADQIIDTLEQAKVNTDTLMLIPPFNLAPAVWNTSISILQASIKAGDSLVQAINKAIEYIKTQVKDFDPKPFKRYFIDKYGPKLNAEELAEVQDMGFDEGQHFYNALGKYLPKEFEKYDGKSFAEIPSDIKQQLVDERNKAKEAKAKDNKGESDSGAGVPDDNATRPASEPGKPLKLAERVLDSDEVSEDVKAGLRELGTTYIPVTLNLTKKEAAAYVESFDENGELDAALENVLDMNNGMTGLTRAAIGAALFKRYREKSFETESLERNKEYADKSARIAAATAVQLKNAGQEINAGKIWKELLSKEPLATVAELDRQYKENNEKVIAPDIKDIRSAKRVMEDLLNSPEVQEIIAAKVDKEIEAKGEQLFGKEQKKRIVNFFDSLLIDTEGKSFDATLGLPIAVWNGAIKAVKHAVLLGASTANAIKAGIDYVNQHHETTWDDRAFELQMKSGIKGLKVNRKVVPTDKQKANILDQWEKRLRKLSKEGRKRLLANSIDELNREGALSEERFKEMYAEALGLETMTDALKQKIFDLIGRINGADEAGSKYKKLFDKEDASKADLNEAKAKWEKSIQDARKANEALSDLFRPKKNVWDTFKVIMQGNLLTSISLATNVYSNALLQPLRFMSGGVASLADYIISQGAKYTALGKIASKDRTYYMATRQINAWKGFIPGVKEGLHDLIHGLTDREISQRDLTTKLQPLKSMADLWATYFGDKNMKTREQVNAWAETVFGVPAELMFRLLNLGDKPFRTMAETGKAFEIAKRKGLVGRQLEKFLEFPDEESAAEIKRAGDESTFQQDNKATEGAMAVEKYVSNVPVFGLLYKAIFPYIKTPSNIIGETIMYALPPLSLLTSIGHARKGDRAKALKYFGIAVTGQMLASVAVFLIKNGLLSDGGGDDDKKERAAKFENIPPNSLNISGMQRLMSGGSAAPLSTDKWINVQKMGVLGTTLTVHANTRADKSLEELNSMSYLDEMISMILPVAKTGIEQSYLQGMNTLLQAIAQGGAKADRLLINIANTISSIAWPNTIASISRTADDVIRETKDPDFWKELENTFKVRTFRGKTLPTKVTIWGAPVPNAPEGRNKWVYSLLDVTKGRTVDVDGFGYKIFDKYRTTLDKDWLTAVPKDDITIEGQKAQLSAKQYEQFQVLVGQKRKELVQQYVGSSDWDSEDDTERLRSLKYLYKEGYDNAKMELIETDPELYKLIEE